jgi:hypothetical protein
VSTVVSVVAQRRRNRQFVALQVAPRNARPAALRDLYRDAGTIRRDDDARLRSGGEPTTKAPSKQSPVKATPAAPVEATPQVPATTQTSR